MNGSKQPQRILVGVDGSTPSLVALDWAIALARPLQAEVVAVYTLPSPSPLEYGYGYSLPVELDPRWQAEMQILFETEWCAALDRSGLRARKLIGTGRPATVLAAKADEVDADLVVVGRRGRGGVAELVLGSVSHELSHHCTKPVVLIASPAGASQEAKRVEAAAAS